VQAEEQEKQSKAQPAHERGENGAAQGTNRDSLCRDEHSKAWQVGVTNAEMGRASKTRLCQKVYSV